jgi:type IV secretory pathway TrbD component
MQTPTTYPVYRSLNKPLTIWGAERRLFFMALVMGAATFNFFGSLFGGVLMFAALVITARWATARDPQLLRILLNSARFKLQYDPAKHHVDSRA